MRQTEPRSFTWTIGGCYVLVRFAQWNWRDETMKRWNKANMEQSWAIISLSHFHRCSFRCTSCYCLLLLKIPEMCSLAIFEIPWGQKWIPCNGNLATELWMKIPWCEMSFVEPCGQILVDRNCLAFHMTIYIDIHRSNDIAWYTMWVMFFRVSATLRTDSVSTSEKCLCQSQLPSLHA